MRFPLSLTTDMAGYMVKQEAPAASSGSRWC